MRDVVSSGTDVVNSLLDGGYEKDSITVIYGPAGSGKTNLMLHAAIHAVNKGKKVIYIDTEGGYSVKRLKQLVPETKKYLDAIVFMRPTTFEKQAKAVDLLAHLAGSKKTGENLGLVIIDSIGNLYRLEHNDADNKTKVQELSLQLKCLNQISREKKIPVLLTNQVYSSFNGSGVRLVGGDLMAYASKCLIELQHENGARTAILRKHRSIGERKENFKIEEKGIKKI